MTNPTLSSTHSARVRRWVCRWLVCGGVWMAGPAAWALAVGNRVTANESVNVRQSAAGTQIGTRGSGDLGTIIGGPQTAALPGGSPLVWWQVNWDTGVDGWSYEGGLTSAPLVYGLDVSHYQGDINWSSVYAAGNRFAIAKATESAAYVDPKFAGNITDGKAAGMIMSAYHFARPLANTAITEARHFVATATPYLTQGALWPVLDLEDGSTLGKTALSAWVRAWCAEVERLTTWKSIIYCNRNFARNFLDADLTIHPLWIAVPDFAPGSDPGNIGPWPRWTLEQYSWTGSVAGISGNVDLDAFNGDSAALAAYLLGPITHVITSTTVAPNPVVRGTTITLTATVSSSVPRSLLLGATLFPAGTSSGGLSDAAHDGPVALIAGTGSPSRQFTLPASLAPGSYDVWMALYNDVDNSGKIDAGDAPIGATHKKSNGLMVAAQPSYATWAAGQGLAGAAALETADPDLDGEPNLREYSFGTSPLSGSSRPGLSVMSIPDPGGPGHSLALQFAHWRGRPDLTYIVQRSADLAAWSTVVSTSNDLPFAGPGVEESGSLPATVTVSVVPATDSPTFLRVKIIKN